MLFALSCNANLQVKSKGELLTGDKPWSQSTMVKPQA